MGFEGDTAFPHRFICKAGVAAKAGSAEKAQAAGDSPGSLEVSWISSFQLHLRITSWTKANTGKLAAKFGWAAMCKPQLDQGGGLRLGVNNKTLITIGSVGEIRFIAGHDQAKRSKVVSYFILDQK